MAKKPKTQSKAPSDQSYSFAEELRDNIKASLDVTYNDRRFFVQSSPSTYDLDESNQLVCQLKGGKLQFLAENAFIAPGDEGVAWGEFFDLELEFLEEFLFDGVMTVLKERGVIA